jgi:hypothetical protein
MNPFAEVRGWRWLYSCFSITLYIINKALEELLGDFVLDIRTWQNAPTR